MLQTTLWTPKSTTAYAPASLANKALQGYDLSASESKKDNKSAWVDLSEKGIELAKKDKTSENEKAHLDPKQIAELKDETHKQLLDMIQNLKKSAQENKSLDIKMIDPILYDVQDTEKAAEVPEEWNADNTSQRIVDFAMSFAGKDDDFESYVEKARAAVQEGFKMAKEDMGSVPGPTAKLYNDTYEAAMKKFDQMLEDHRSSQTAPSQTMMPRLDMVA